MTGDLAGFVLARFAEVEALARLGVRDFGGFAGDAWAPFAWGYELDVNFDWLLADCAAKREIVGLLIAEQPLDQGHWEGPGSDERWVSDHAPELLRLLALPYAGHPDYCEEWRP